MIINDIWLKGFSYFYNPNFDAMTELILNSVIIALVIVALFVLYYQTRIYREQKELIEKESKALKILRHKNLEALRTRFLLRRVKI